LLGLSDGWLLAYEYPSLERIESKQIFWEDEKEDQFEDLSFNSDFDSNQSPEKRRDTLVMETNESEGGNENFNAKK
jgi:hypothetical protein